MFDLQGHRGARGLWPENTLTGFARTIELGVCALEFDVAVTRDGVVVVSHDPELNRDCTRDAGGRFLSGTGPPICTLSYAQLQTYDVGRLRPGSAYAARFPAQQPLDGEHIPRLADVLALVRARGRGRVRVCIEIKTFPEQPELTPDAESFVAAVGQDVARTDTAALAAVIAFDWRVVQTAQRLMPDAETTALTAEQPGEDTVRFAAPQPSPWLGGLDARQFDGSIARLVQASGAGTWARTTATSPPSGSPRRTRSGCAWCPGPSTSRTTWSECWPAKWMAWSRTAPTCCARCSGNAASRCHRAPRTRTEHECRTHPGHRWQPRGDPRAADRRGR